MRHLIAMLVLVIGLGTIPGVAGAQAIDLPSVDPAVCAIDPIDFNLPGADGDLNAATPVPTAIAIEPSQPVDDETAGLIVERIAQSISCQNAGDLPRMLANFSSAWRLERFSGYDRVFLQRFMERAAAPEPLSDEERIVLVSIDDIRVRDDGVALAVVTTSQHGDEQTSLLALVQESGLWLIDSGQPLVTD